MFSVLSLTSLLPSCDRNKYGGIRRWSINFFKGCSLCYCDAIYRRVLLSLQHYLETIFPTSVLHLQSLFIINHYSSSIFLVSISSSAVSSLNNICHKCTSVLNKKTGTVAPDGSSNSPVDSLREKVGLQRRTLLMKLRHYYDFLKKETNSLVASLEQFSRYLETNLRYLEKKNENFPKHIQVNISDI